MPDDEPVENPVEKAVADVDKVVKTKPKPKRKKPQKRPQKKAKKTIRVAHEMSADRRKEIKLALKEHESEHRDEWDRSSGQKSHVIMRKRVKPGQMRTMMVNLLDVEIGDAWPIPITVIHGSRPGPVVTITGGIHGDELTGPSACTHLLSTSMTDPERPLDPTHIAGTIRIIPIINLPGYRNKSRYFPDGRDLNREFPGRIKGNTTSRVAYRLWNDIIKSSDYLIDLHSAAKGRINMPQVRANLADPHSNIVAKAFGIEVILDSKPPKGSLRRTAMKAGIGCMTYEGGGADNIDHESTQVAVNGVLNVLKSLHVIPGNPTRPRFRLLAQGSTWLRAGEGGLLDMWVGPSSVVEEGEIVATISDPAHPGLTVDIIAPGDGLMICTATNPHVSAGTPVGHFLPLSKHAELIRSQLDENNMFIISGSEDEPVWREEVEVDEISLEGEWSGGSVDAEWQTAFIGDSESGEAGHRVS
ncbi:MAG TPA: succinylglutamate desuccinylase/aspartoacylase family protein [Candidatus Poseidoniales archaeon]|nr:succinylglutamate desuccinylase/aspartoacylase family protein [Candidatus Poseidoniales archaeon]